MRQKCFNKFYVAGSPNPRAHKNRWLESSSSHLFLCALANHIKLSLTAHLHTRFCNPDWLGSRNQVAQWCEDWSCEDASCYCAYLLISLIVQAIVHISWFPWLSRQLYISPDFPDCPGNCAYLLISLIVQAIVQSGVTGNQEVWLPVWVAARTLSVTC